MKESWGGERYGAERWQTCCSANVWLMMGADEPRGLGCPFDRAEGAVTPPCILARVLGSRDAPERAPGTWLVAAAAGAEARECVCEPPEATLGLGDGV